MNPPPMYYEPVSVAIEKLRKKGFTVDFNLEENCLVCDADKYAAEDFDIVEIYRYEGASDPGDQATVYAIQSKKGVKGILVNGYGMSSDSMSTAILDKLKIQKD